MKTLIILALFCAVTLANVRSRRGFQKCASNEDCEGGCCFGGFYCMKYLEEDDLCAIRNAIGCGCRPGLECVQTGPFWQQCKDTTPGSGGF